MNYYTSSQLVRTRDGDNSSRRQLELLGRVKRIPLWFLPLAVSIFLFLPLQSLNLPADGAKYLSYGLNVYEGNGFAEANGNLVYRRPGLPYLIAFSFALFGKSVSSAFIITRLFFVFSAVSIYFFCRELFNRWVGLIASILVLSSTSLNFWSTYIHLDHILPVFMILYLACSYRAMCRESYVYFILAGISLGIGCLIKETALLVAPIPAVAFCLTREFRQISIVKGLILSAAATLTIFVPWMVYAYFGADAGVEYAAVGSSAALAQNKLADYDQNVAALGVSQYVQATLNYYNNYMLPHFKLSPLMVVAWGAIIVTAFVKRRREYIYLSIAVAPLMVIVLFQGTVGYRARQGIVLYLLSYCALAGFLFLAGSGIHRLIRSLNQSVRLNTKHLAVYLALLFGLLSTFFQLSQERVVAGSMDRFLSQYNSIEHFAKAQDPLIWDVSGRRGEVAENVARWITDNVKPGAALLGDAQYLSSIYFYTDAKYEFHEMFYPSVLWYMDEINNAELLDSVDAKKVEPLYIWAVDSTTGKLEQSRLFILMESYLLQTLAENSIQYIVIPPRMSFLANYFMEAPGYSKAASFDNGAIQIYEVINIQPSEFDLHVSENVSVFFEIIAKRNPARYEQISETFLQHMLGWSSSDTFELLTDNHVTFDNTDIVQMNEFASSVVALPVRRDKVMEKYSGSTLGSTVNVWDYLILSHLYLAENDSISAQMTLADLLNDAVLDPFVISEATSLFKQIWDSHTHDEGHNLTAISDLLIEKYQLLISQEQAISDTYWEFANLLQLTGRIDYAEGIYRQAAEQSILAYEAYIKLGQLYDNNGEPENAIASYIAATHLTNTDATGYILLAKTYKRQGDIDAAIATYEAAINVLPANTRLHLDLGKLYREKTELTIYKE